jgi:hypothetical protein
MLSVLPTIEKRNQYLVCIQEPFDDCQNDSSDSLANVRPREQTLVPSKKKNLLN